jgi:hypothetical protein
LSIEVALQNERGEILAIVHDSKNQMPKLLERSAAHEPFLAQIDWYGDTTFGRVQMPRFLSAWRVLARHTQSADEAFIRVSALVPHIKFVSLVFTARILHSQDGSEHPSLRAKRHNAGGCHCAVGSLLFDGQNQLSAFDAAP